MLKFFGACGGHKYRATRGGQLDYPIQNAPPFQLQRDGHYPLHRPAHKIMIRGGLGSQGGAQSRQEHPREPPKAPKRTPRAPQSTQDTKNPVRFPNPLPVLPLAILCSRECDNKGFYGNMHFPKRKSLFFDSPASVEVQNQFQNIETITKNPIRKIKEKHGEIIENLSGNGTESAPKQPQQAKASKSKQKPAKVSKSKQ